MQKRAVASAIAALLLLGACAPGSSAEDADKDQRSPLDKAPAQIAAIIDPDGGTVAPGSSRFIPDFYHTFLLDYVKRTAENVCLEREGYRGALDQWDAPDPLYKVAVTQPPWLPEQAERFAFLPPQPLADLLGNGVIVQTASAEQATSYEKHRAERVAASEAFAEAQGTAEYKSAKAACATDPDVKRWEGVDLSAKSSGPWLAEFQDDMTSAFQDPQMKAIKNDFVACIEGEGLEPASPSDASFDGLYAVKGQSLAKIDEQQVRLAVVVADCKESTEAVAREMAIWSRYEAATYAKYERELTEAQTYLEGLYGELDDYVASHS